MSNIVRKIFVRLSLKSLPHKEAEVVRNQLSKACVEGNIRIVQSLHRKYHFTKEEILDNYFGPFNLAQYHGQVRLMDWLYMYHNLTRSDIRQNDDYFLRWAMIRKNISTARWIATISTCSCCIGGCRTGSCRTDGCQICPDEILTTSYKAIHDWIEQKCIEQYRTRTGTCAKLKTRSGKKFSGLPIGRRVYR